MRIKDAVLGIFLLMSIISIGYILCIVTPPIARYCNVFSIIIIPALWGLVISLVTYAVSEIIE